MPLEALKHGRIAKVLQAVAGMLNTQLGLDDNLSFVGQWQTLTANRPRRIEIPSMHFAEISTG